MPNDESAQHWVDLGLFDPNAAGADQRREVLVWLDSLGVEAHSFMGTHPDELLRAVSDRLQRPGPRFTAEEARERLGLQPDVFGQLCRAAGYSGEDLFTELDIEAFGAFGTAVDLFSASELLHFSRVLSSAMARVADAASSLFRIDVGAALEAKGGTELEWMQKNHEVSQLVSAIHTPMQAFLLRQLQDSALRGDMARERLDSTADASTLRLAVGFVDLVGYTPIADALEPDDLGRFMRAFEEQAYDTVGSGNGRVVKLIGDEVMFVAADPTDACVIASELLDAFGAGDAVPRGGVAFGDLVALGGDYYGRVVNLASRIADIAVPGEVLVDQALAAEVASFGFETAGRRQLKGFEVPVALLSLVRPAQS